MATHSSVLAWRIPWTDEPGGLHSHKEWDMTERLTVSGNQSQTLLGWRIRLLCLPAVSIQCVEGDLVPSQVISFKYGSVYMSIPMYPSSPPFRFGNHKFSKSVCFASKLISIIFKDSTYKWYHTYDKYHYDKSYDLQYKNKQKQNKNPTSKNKQSGTRDWHLKMGPVLWDQALNLWSLCWLWVVSEVNCWTPSWYLENWWVWAWHWGGETIHIGATSVSGDSFPLPPFYSHEYTDKLLQAHRKIRSIIRWLLHTHPSESS